MKRWISGIALAALVVVAIASAVLMPQRSQASTPAGSGSHSGSGKVDSKKDAMADMPGMPSTTHSHSDSPTAAPDRPRGLVLGGFGLIAATLLIGAVMVPGGPGLPIPGRAGRAGRKGGIPKTAQTPRLRPDEPSVTTMSQVFRGEGNLLDFRVVGAVMRSRLFPGVLQFAMTGAFVLIVYQLLLGPDQAANNLGTALTWVLWWPLLPIIFLVFSRFWCAVCPFGALNDLVQRHFGLQRRVPKFLNNYGIWVINASFLLITWADHVWGIIESPWGSGVLFLIITMAVIVTGVLFQRRAFCRHLCFLGGLAGNYARTGMVSLRADPDVCKTCTSRAACYNGTEKAPECPIFTFPRTMDSNADCTLCSRCIKNCPNDALKLTVHKPTRELWFVRKPRFDVAFLAMAIMGIVLIQNLTMIGIWNNILTTLQHALGTTNYVVIFTLVLLIAVFVPIGLLFAASAIAARVNRVTVLQNFSLFGYALIPLSIAGHIAHNLFHLLGEGKSVLYTLRTALGMTNHGTSTAFAPTSTIQLLQYVMIAIGIGASLYAAWRLAKNHHLAGGSAGLTILPFAVLIVLLGALDAGMASLPMSHRV